MTPDDRHTHAWRRLRREWAAKIRAGGVTCARCGGPIPADTPGTGWDLGHLVDAQHGGTMTGARPEHAHCNRSAGARSRRRWAAWQPTEP